MEIIYPQKNLKEIEDSTMNMLNSLDGKARQYAKILKFRILAWFGTLFGSMILNTLFLIMKNIDTEKYFGYTFFAGIPAILLFIYFILINDKPTKISNEIEQILEKNNFLAKDYAFSKYLHEEIDLSDYIPRYDIIRALNNVKDITKYLKENNMQVDYSISTHRQYDSWNRAFGDKLKVTINIFANGEVYDSKHSTSFFVTDDEWLKIIQKENILDFSFLNETLDKIKAFYPDA